MSTATRIAAEPSPKPDAALAGRGPHCHAPHLVSRVVWVAGEFLAPEEARVPLLDRGYQLGEGVFATLRAYDGRCFRARRHLEQLRRAAALFGLNVPDAIDGVLDIAAARTRSENARVRVTVSETTASVLAEPLVLPSDDDYAHGISAVTVAARRVPPICFDGTLKTTSYAPQTLARREAEARGAAEGIQLAVDGSLAGATMANLFLVRENELATPPLDSGCRAGITREAVLEIAARLGLETVERRVMPAELRECDEAFLTSTRIECLPLSSVDGEPVPIGLRARALRIALQELVRHERIA